MAERAKRREAVAPGSAARSANISPAREAAFAILERVGNSAAHSDDLLHGPGVSGLAGLAGLSELSQADRNLTTTLVLGVLRWQIALDARLRPLLQRPEVELASPVATALRLGAFQLLYLDRIPAHAALSESVEMARAGGHGHASGMVNAVLRKLTRQEPVKPKVFETTAALAERLAHPAWLVERWVREYGRSAALAVCAYDQKPPAAGSLFAKCQKSAGTAVAEGGNGAVLPRMDDGSRLVAELVASCLAVRPAAGLEARRIWDCCAAPGGKTLVLAWRHPEAEVLATDVNPRRVRMLSERLAGTANARVLEADATRLPAQEGEFDLVLCDVPCSGTGTLARNPEIKQRLQPAELARQAQRQREILAAALARLAPGGRLVYSTCSLEPEENERVVEAVCADDGFEVLPIVPVLRLLVESGVLAAGVEIERLVRGEYLRTLPGMGFQGDGFFAAVLARR